MTREILKETELEILKKTLEKLNKNEKILPISKNEALHIAIIYEDKISVKKLLKHDANPLAANFVGQSALVVSASKDNLEIFKLLYKKIPVTPELYKQLTETSELTGNKKITKFLLENKPPEQQEELFAENVGRGNVFIRT